MSADDGHFLVAMAGAANMNMVGWQRIVQTLGEKIGKSYLTPMAWVLTLPMAILLSGSLYWLFTKLF